MKAKPRITKTQARAWTRRWKLVNKAERQELRTTPIEAKFRQLATMMHTARVLGWKTSTDAETQAVRDRWIRLKRAILDAG